MARWLLVGLGAWVWITDARRYDVDVDGVPVQLDCNDRNASVQILEPVSGDLTCGDTVAGSPESTVEDDLAPPCVHPFDPAQLLGLAGEQWVYRLTVPESRWVTVRLDATALTSPGFGNSDEERRYGVAMLANRGATCSDETCRVGLPVSSSEERLRGDAWHPTVSFAAAAAEEWFVIVNDDDEAGTFTLEVECD